MVLVEHVGTTHLLDREGLSEIKRPAGVVASAILAAKSAGDMFETVYDFEILDYEEAVPM